MDTFLYAKLSGVMLTWSIIFTLLSIDGIYRYVRCHRWLALCVMVPYTTFALILLQESYLEACAVLDFSSAPTFEERISSKSFWGLRPA